MANIIACTKCAGSKRIAPLGGMSKICDLCDGIGYIDKPPGIVVETVELVGNESKPVNVNDTRQFTRLDELKESLLNKQMKHQKVNSNKS